MLLMIPKIKLLFCKQNLPSKVNLLKYTGLPNVLGKFSQVFKVSYGFLKLLCFKKNLQKQNSFK